MAEATPEECLVSAREENCLLREEVMAKHYAVTCLRLLSSSLSVLGTVTIITSAVSRRVVFSPKVFPIFMISIADLLLALLWIGGGVVWWERGLVENRGWCFAISLPTIILQCVTLNLTLIYAWRAHAHVKKRVSAARVRTLSLSAISSHGAAARVARPAVKVYLAYIIGWIVPVVLVMVPFAALEGKHDIIAKTNRCSCWCVPGFGNILPNVYKTKDHKNDKYRDNIDSLLLSYGLAVGLEYLIIFTLLVFTYIMILSAIHKIKYQLLRQNGQKQVRRRIISILSVFIFTGLANLVASWFIVIKMSLALDEQSTHSWKDWTFFITFFQSLVTPLQGFLNAIVYGWTREDFVNTVATTTSGVLTASVKSIGAEAESHYLSDFEATIQVNEMDDGELNGSSVNPQVGPLTGPFLTPPPAPSLMHSSRT